MSNFYITKEVIRNVPILIVDVEQFYLVNEDVYGLIEESYHAEVKLELKDRMNIMCENLKDLTNPLYTVHHTPLYEKISLLPIHDLKEWSLMIDKNSGKYFSYSEFSKIINDDNYNGMIVDTILHPNVMISLKNYNEVLVCGLWKDRCVYKVTKLLNENGVKAILLDNDNYSICSELIGDGYPIAKLAYEEQHKVIYL